MKETAGLPIEIAQPGSVQRFMATMAARYGMPPRAARCLFWLCSGITSNKALAAHLGRDGEHVHAALRCVYRALGTGRRDKAILIAWEDYRAAQRRMVRPEAAA